jgi:Holliday junction resolvase RusA-like endonuclease
MRFIINGEPVGKGRPRFSRVGNYVHTYNPPKTAAFERKVKTCYLETTMDKFHQAVIIYIKAYMGIPSSISKKKKEEMIGRPCLKKPDVDNLAKCVLDGLNGVAYDDDSQVYSLTIEKYWSDEPRTEVIINEMV